MLLYQNKRDSDFSVVSIPGDGGKCALFSSIFGMAASLWEIFILQMKYTTNDWLCGRDVSLGCSH